MMESESSGRGDRPAGRPFATRSPTVARNGMAAASHPLASLTAIDVMREGGSAVDAAIAANAMLGVMEPVNCGVGGDLFALVWDPATEALHGLNASGRSPRGQSYEMLAERLGGGGIPQFGPLSVSVPGAVDGWFELHARFGLLPVDSLLAPSIAYARDGFAVPQVIAHHWADVCQTYEGERQTVVDLDNFRRTFLPDGRPPAEGQSFSNPDLARVYEMIADGGRDAFYVGEIADVIDAYMRRVDGPLRKADLADHKSTWVRPVSTTYRDAEVYELPPNGQGIAVLQMLNVLEGYDLAAMGHNSADYLHVQVEAKRLAFEDRARFFTDPDFYDAPVEELVSKEYAARRREMIRMDHVLEGIRHGDPALRGGDTVYLTTADADGMMVSLIQSNYFAMGSGLVPDGLGFGLQNRGSLFSMDPNHPNVYAPGKRPFHTIIPGFATRAGRPYLSFGVMGGDMQPQGHVQVLCNLIDFGMNVQEAGDAARYRHDGGSLPTGAKAEDRGVLMLESGVGPDVRRQLTSRGHWIGTGRGGFGGYQAILRDEQNGAYHGATEMRKDGQAVGY